MHCRKGAEMSAMPPRSPSPSGLAGAVLAICRAIVAVLAQLVPRDRRADWEAEWHGELWELARHPHRIDDRHQSRLVVERLQRELHETDARSQQLIATGDEIEARRRELLVLE